MTIWDDLAAAANISIGGVFGETVSYSRAANRTFDAMVSTSITAIPHLGMEFQGNNAPTHALQVIVSDIQEGPQRGDSIVWRGSTYLVHTVIPPAPPYVDGTALLGIRKVQE